MAVPTSPYPPALDHQPTSERQRVVNAWRQFEEDGKPNELLLAAKQLIGARARKAAVTAGLDPDDVTAETNAELLRRRLAKRPADRCINDEHCLGRFGSKVRFAIRDAVESVRRSRGREERLADGHEQVPDPDPVFGRYLERDAVRHAMDQLELCRQRVLADQEAVAFDSAHLAEERLSQREIADRMGVTDRWVRSLLKSASKKLRRCLERRGVRL